MAMSAIRILHINAGSKNFGGVSAFLLNLYRNIDREKISFDFLTPNKTTYEQYRAEIEGCGGHIYDLGINSSSFKGKKKLQKALSVFLSEHKYDIIQVNSGVLSFNYMVAKACRKYSDSIIIVHSHNNGGRSSLKEKFSAPLKSLLVKKADKLLACSLSAAEYMFPEKAAHNETVIIKNGIVPEKFAYSPEIRQQLRKELGIANKYVIGNVGRFVPQKNHSFMLDVFSQLLKKEPDAVLMLIGEGELTDEIKNKAAGLGIADKVMFMGLRRDIEKYYQAMDVFFLPSVFEGLGIVNIEAQAAGLHCVVSDVVPQFANAAGMIKFISLDDDKDVWIKALLENKDPVRQDGSVRIREAGFDISNTGKVMTEIYTQLMNNNK